MFDRKASLYLVGFFFLLFSLLIIQFYRLQIIEHEKWDKRAKLQHEFVIEEPARRGVFFASILKPNQPETSQLLVMDVPYYHLYVDPLALPEEYKKEIIQKLSPFLLLKGKEKEKFSLHFAKKSRSRKLMSWVERSTQREIYQWWISFIRGKKIPSNALYFIEDYKRSYPYGHLLGQILHTVREDKEISTGRSIPTGGLEMIFDSYLAGKPGKRTLLRTIRNPMDGGAPTQSPERGADIHLTIDYHIQTIAEEEIKNAVKKTGAKFGWAIMMDPFTGEVLALAQYPFFNPTNYREFYNDPESLQHTKVRALTDPFEPGSTMKPITMAIALMANEEMKKRGKSPLFSPTEKINTAQGSFPGRANKPIKDLRQHHFLNMYMGIQKSSNIYMGRVVQRVIEALGDEWYHDALEKVFGFGSKTGIELPSESPGFLPHPLKKLERGGFEWATSTPYSLAMGYNLLANGLQMVRAHAVLANGGYLVTPHLVKKIVKQDSKGNNQTLFESPKSFKNKDPLLPPSLIQEVVKAMKYTTKFSGTAPSADIPGYTEAGKTSTTEKVIGGVYSKQVHFSTFIGFAPVSKPRFVLLIGIDEPEYKYIPGVGKNHQGGFCCGPVFSKMGLRTLKYLEEKPDDPYGYPTGDPRANLEKADWIKETTQQKQLYEAWNAR